MSRLSTKEKEDNIPEGIGVIIVTTSGKIALQQRDDKPGIASPGKISLFGGKVEDEETPKGCVRRELMEELEIAIEPKSITFLGDYRKTFDTDGADWLIHVFVVKQVTRRQMNLKEGKAIVSIGQEDNFDDLNLTRIARLALTDYRNFTRT